MHFYKTLLNKQNQTPSGSWKIPGPKSSRMLTKRSSESSSSVNEHLDSIRASKEIYSPLKFLFDEQDDESPFPTKTRANYESGPHRSTYGWQFKASLRQRKADPEKWDSRASITSQVEERRNTELNNYLDTFQMKVLEALAVVEEIILLSDLTHKFINDYAFFLKSVRNVEHNTAMGLRKTLSWIILLRFEKTNRPFLLQESNIERRVTNALAGQVSRT